MRSFGTRGEKNSIMDEPGNYSGHIQKTSDFLDEFLYWEIIAESLKAKDLEEQEKILREIIGKLTPEQIIGFALRTEMLMYNLRTDEIECAQELMTGGRSKKDLEDFISWVISRGKEVYYNAKENPDSLISQADLCSTYYFPNFSKLDAEVFELKTGKKMYEFIGDDVPDLGYPKVEYKLDEDDPVIMKAVFPKLFERFWNNRNE